MSSTGKRGSHVKPGAVPQQTYLEGLRYATKRDGQPFLLELGTGQDMSVQLPLFRDAVQLGEFYYTTQGPGVIFETVIRDRDEFLRAIPGHVDIVIEPHRNEDGKWEYFKVLRD